MAILDTSNAIAQKLVFATIAAVNDGDDLVNGNAATLLTSGSYVDVPPLVLDSSSSTNGGAYWPIGRINEITTDFALVVKCSYISGAAGRLINVPIGTAWASPHTSIGLVRSASTDQLAMILTNTSQQVAYSDTGLLILNEPENVYGVDVVGTTVIFYRNGVQYGASKTITSSAVDWGTNQPVTLLNRSSTSPQNGMIGQSEYGFIAKGGLSAAEHLSLYNDPGQIWTESTGGNKGGFIVNVGVMM